MTQATSNSVRQEMSTKSRIRVLYAAEGCSVGLEGGGKTHVEEVIKALARRGFDVTLVIRGRKEDLKTKNLVLRSLPDWRFPWSFFSYILGLAALGLQALIERPTFVYQRDSGINAGVLTARLFHIPVVLEINGDIMEDDPSIRGIIAPLLRLTVKITYSSASVVTTPTQELLLTLWSLGANSRNTILVPNGVDPRIFRPMLKSKCREVLGLDNSYSYFCFVGTLLPWQGLDGAIRAFSKFLEENEDLKARLIVIGEGPTRRNLQKLANQFGLQGNVVFLGNVPHRNVPLYINASDICLAPFTSWRNKDIGLSPIKLLEYLACGKPVVASAVPGVTSLVRGLDAGILVEPDNVEDLKEAYVDALIRLPYWEKRIQILCNEIANNHSWDKMVGIVLKALGKTILELRPRLISEPNA